ncbi:MAG: amino acid adenylation domain-containing protein [Candidatus Hermodarchaeia archaeon]
MIPLSWSQRRLWFLDQLESENSAYDNSICFAVQLSGPLNVSVLEQSINEVVRRHETLRTKFDLMKNQPVQLIDKNLQISLAVMNLEEVPSDDQEIEIRELIVEEIQTPFDLTQGPLFRAKLLRISQEEHVLILTAHQIIADDWSVRVLNHELSILYEAFISDKPSPLEELPIQYMDYSSWQRDRLRDERTVNDLSFWKQQLSGRLPVLQLPTDYPRSSEHADINLSCSLVLKKNLSKGLRELSKKEGVSLCVTQLAAFITLISRLTGNEDVIIGLQISGRELLETHELIGPFANSVALRIDLSTILRFQDLLRLVRDVISDSHSHSEIPFEMLVEELQPERDLGRAPLYQAGFLMRDVEEEPLQLPGLRSETLVDHVPLSGLDINLDVIESGEEIQLVLRYRADIFVHNRITEMLNQFEQLLVQIVEHPDRTLQSYSLMTPSAQEVIPNPKMVLPEPEFKPITTFISSWIGPGSDSPAICKDGRLWTYRDLAKCANAISQVLLACEVQVGDVVAVTGERSFGLIASMSGVLLCGGVLLNIDPSLPTQRKHHMLQHANVKYLLVVGDPQTKDEWISKSVTPLNVDPDEGQILHPPISLHATEITLPVLKPGDAAYLFFTSGSTGVPKGVLGSHKGLSHFLKWQSETFNIGSSDRSAQLTGLSFDVVLRDIFTPLISHATLHLPSEENILDPGRILPWMESEMISILHTVPSVAQAWLANVPVGVTLRELRKIFFAGEPLTETLVRRWKDAFPESGEIINLYGPTETTLAKCFFEVPSEPLPGIQPIGFPIPETQALVLGNENQQCGIGESGQIVLRTPFRTLGYFNDIEENKRKFIKNPFRDDDSDLVYLTGDRGRYRHDGSLEILGRVDHQVKLRGIRIELGEIESVLGQHPDVREVVATIRADTSSEKRLVAYVTTYAEHQLTNSNLQRYMRQHLPDAMVPSAFVLMERFPLTPNGKVDRLALPEPEWISPVREQVYVAPQSHVEKSLAITFEEILGVDCVGIYDNFFELGGHSLLAAQVTTRVREILNVDLPIRSLFDTPTLSDLAEFVENQLGRLPDFINIQSISREQRIPLSHFQEPLWFIDQLQPGNPAYILSTAFRLSGFLDLAGLENSINEIIKRHESLRTNFVVRNDEPVQIVSPNVEIKIDIIELDVSSKINLEAQVQKLINQEARRSFDLEKDPLLRVKIIRLGEYDHVLSITLHHLVSDGWSQGVLLRELSFLYKAFSGGMAPPLPELTIQYPDYALWHKRWFQENDLEPQLSYWREQLGSNPPVLELPTDKVRPAIQTYRGGKKFFKIPKEIYDELVVLSKHERCTTFMTVLAIFNTLLHRYTAQDSVIVGTPFANRTRPETESMIGLFLNMLVLNTDMAGDPTFRELLAQVREVTLEAYSNTDVPFERLVEALQPQRVLSQSPIFQVLIEMAPKNVLDLEGLTVTSLNVDNGSAQFDLSLRLEESLEGLEGHFEYNIDLFNSSTIDRIAGHFQAILRAVVSNPEVHISEIPMMSDSEIHQLVVEWNNTRVDYQDHLCIHQLFEAQVELTPDAVAVGYEDEEITYAEFNKRSNQLAHHLMRLGVGPDVFVGVYMERSIEMVIALYAILKAGGAYVPLDPDYPLERVEFMIGDTQVPVILTQKMMLSKLPKNSAKVIPLDSSWDAINQESTANPTCEVTSENLAYVIYTSGSTGTPKGVMNHHKGILNRLLWMQDKFQLDTRDRVLQKTPYSFDVSVWEFFWPLLTGARLIIARPGGHLDSAYLTKLIRDHRITTLHFVPSMLQVFLEEQDVESCYSLKRVICSGEALPYDLQERFFQRLNTELHNLYGPTEAAVDVTHWHCQQKSDLRIVPIGRPIANTNLYILDANLLPVPIGVPGELHIGGIQVARGYLNREELTAEKFIPDPFSDDPKSRLYKTGDLVRFLPDGSIEFLGRLDFQVKIRGFRIELGEIEAVLTEYPAVREAVVLVRQDIPEERRLVAYVVPKKRSEMRISEIREFLQQKLPDYMVPAAFVQLEVLPLTPNGKIDRRDLPAPQWEFQPEKEFVAPSKELEKIIGDIWQELLQLQRVGIDDSFFELGGHSLLLVRAHRRILEFTEKELSIMDMFRYPTIRTLTEYLIGEEDRETSTTIQKKVDRAGERRAVMTRRRKFRKQARPRDTDENK